MNSSGFITFHCCFHTFITAENHFLSIPNSNRVMESAGIFSVGQTTLNHSGEQKFITVLQKFITVLSHQPWIFSAEMIKAKLSLFFFFFPPVLYLHCIHPKERNFKAAEFRIIKKICCMQRGEAIVSAPIRPGRYEQALRVWNSKGKFSEFRIFLPSLKSVTLRGEKRVMTFKGDRRKLMAFFSVVLTDKVQSDKQESIQVLGWGLSWVVV